MKQAHNKKRNVSLLYEILIRNLTKSIMEGDGRRKNAIVLIMKQFFSKGKALKEELDLYNILHQTRGMKRETAKRLLVEVSRAYNNFNTNDHQGEQGKLVSKINKTLGKDVFKTFVPNYRNLATIYQLFNNKLNPRERVILEEKVLDFITSDQEIPVKENVKATNNYTFRMFIEAFNKTYSECLLIEQKELLSRYVVASIDGGVELKIYLNEEIERAKNILKASLEEKFSKEDKEISEKTQIVLKLLESYREKQDIDKEMLGQLLKIQQLVKDVVEE